MHENRNNWPCRRVHQLIVSFFFAMLFCGSAIAQPKDEADKDKTAAAEAAKAIVGRFGDGALSIVIEPLAGKYQGTITRGGKSFPFTGELKGAQFIGNIEIGGAKSGFTATVEGDELVLTLGLDAQKLPRIVTPPAGGLLKNTTRKEVLLARSEDVQLDSELASPDNRRIGFIIQRDGFRHAVIDGVEGKAYRRVGALEFSPDSRRHSYVVQQGPGQLRVVVDEVEGEPFESLQQNLSRFSPDSKRLAYIGMRGDKWWAVIDGRKSEAYDQMLFITFSPDSKRTAFAARRGQAWHVVVDGVQGPAVDEVGKEGILFSPDSKRVAYTAIQGGKHFAVVDGVQGKPCEAISGFAFSPDSLRTYYLALRSGEYVLTVDGQDHGIYESILGLSFSSDSKHTVLGARQDRKSFHVINDRREAAYDEIAAPVFSPDNQQIVYAARQNLKWSLMRDGKSGKFHDQIPFIAFSPDSRRLAYVAMDGGQARVVIDDAPSASFESIWRNGLYFSPDSKHFVFGARGGENSFLIVDGVEDKPVGSFVPGSQVVFDGNDRFQIITRRGSSYYKLEVQINAKGS